VEVAYAQFAYYYDRLMADMPYSSWMSFLRECWHRHQVNPLSLVDLGCGTGNLTLQLAQVGLQVTGIDISTDMLAVAQEKTEELGKLSGLANGGSVHWIEQDIRYWELPHPMDCAISFCDCLNYLTDEKDVRLAFQRTFAGLSPGGLFIFDVHAPRQLIGYAEAQPFVMNDEDISYIWTCDYDEVRREIEHHLVIFVRENEKSVPLYRRTEEFHVQRAYPAEWIRLELEECGFEIVSVSADFTFNPPTEESERLFFAARRP
jgi:SAM-dependent methyltransferase